MSSLRTALVLIGMSMASGCASGGTGGAPASGRTVTITVRNPSPAPVSVSVCAPVECSAFREIAGEREAEFSFDPARGTRAVVTARRGDHVVDRQPVDFLAGQRYRVVLHVP
ncbi:MAG TPA: hypothetical protein VF006_32090 [Longimicrobium sp.]